MAKLTMRMVLFCVIISVYVSGCSSSRVTSTLKPHQDANLSHAGIKFRIDEVQSGSERAALGTNYNALAKQAYPLLFSTEASAWPLAVLVDRVYDQKSLQFGYHILTLGIIPSWEEATEKYKVTALIPGAEAKPVFFEMEWGRWGGWIPLFLPMPGVSDVRGDENIREYTLKCIVEAVSQQVKQLDAQTLSMLNDPKEIAKLSICDPFCSFREAALSKITQTNLLYAALVAADSEKANRFFREAPPKIIKMIVTEAPDMKVRLAALRYLDDVAFVRSVAQNDPDSSIRQAAMKLAEEGSDWDLAKKVRTLSGYKDFLQKYPSTIRLRVTTASRNYNLRWSVSVPGQRVWGTGRVTDEQGTSYYDVGLRMAIDAGMIDDPDAEPSVKNFQNYQQAEQRKRQKYRLYIADLGKDDRQSVVAIESINP